ncbi:MAG: hypothetical protein GX136_03760 [Clostridiales bacterium]|nr:hypothetical protein [Clostridiales bacterium]
MDDATARRSSFIFITAHRHIPPKTTKKIIKDSKNTIVLFVFLLKRFFFFLWNMAMTHHPAFQPNPDKNSSLQQV